MKNTVRNLFCLFLSLLFHFVIFITLFADMSFRAQSAPLENKMVAEVVLTRPKSTEEPEGLKLQIPNNVEKVDESKAITQVQEEENKMIETPEIVPKAAKAVEPQKNDVKERAKPIKKPAPQKTIVKNETREKHEINADINNTDDNKKGGVSSSSAIESPKKSENAGVSQSQTLAPASITAVDSVTVLNRVKPVYPQISRKRGEEGNVVLLANVLNGKVVNVNIEKSSGIKALDASALAAVAKWSFSTDTNTVVRIPVSFRLKD